MSSKNFIEREFFIDGAAVIERIKKKTGFKTQEAIAKDLGFSHSSALSNYKNRPVIPIEFFLLIREKYGETIDYWIFGDDNNRPAPGMDKDANSGEVSRTDTMETVKMEVFNELQDRLERRLRKLVETEAKLEYWRNIALESHPELKKETGG